MKRLSAKARMFRDHNQTTRLVSAAWLDKDGKEPKGPPETWVQHRVEFTDGTVMVLSDVDMAALNEHGILPKWVIRP